MKIADEGVPQVVLAPTTRHSEKPAEVDKRIERLYPGAAKLEMFARGRREGWAAWGDDPAVATSDC
jgi:N6-adenosine-specific RNA methylase IME4